METIITTLPIHSAKNRQAHERAKNTRQANDKPISIVCPRHRLPSFQWKDGADAVTGFYNFEMISGNYSGIETTLCTDWVSHTVALNHTGMNIANTVSGGAFVAYTNTFSVKTGDIIRIKGTMTGFVAPNPQIYMMPDASTVYSLNNGSVDFEYRARVSSSAAFFVLSSSANITFTFLAVSITRQEGRKELYWYMYPDAVPIFDHDYWTYHGETLNYPLDTGDHYLKITTYEGFVYYSDWFRVDCVYENLISEWNNNGYDHFNLVGTTSTSLDVINDIAPAAANTFSGLFTVNMGEVITVRFNLSCFGAFPELELQQNGETTHLSAICANGLNDFQFTTTWEGDTYINIKTTDLNDTFITSDVIVNRTYSEKYIIMKFSNICDLGDILYHTGMIQTLWFISEPIECIFPQEEEGMKNGEGRFVRTFARQVKKYLIRTPLLPDYMVEVFNRMKLHDSIQLTNLVGDIHTIYNLEVEHEWFDIDKYYAKIDLTFDHDETFVIAGCCNNIV